MHLNNNPIIIHAGLLHILLGSLLLIQKSPAGITLLNIQASWIKHPALLGWALISIGLLAILSISPLPQQANLTISAIGSGTFIHAGSYADGTKKPRLFILADQSHIILLAITHGSQL